MTRFTADSAADEYYSYTQNQVQNVTKLIRRSCFLLAAAGVIGLAGCSHSPMQTESPSTAIDSERSTILLVSLEDGSFVRQTVELDADICVKAVESSTTTCLTQGEAIVNNSGVLVGYEMIPATIELQGFN